MRLAQSRSISLAGGSLSGSNICFAVKHAFLNYFSLAVDVVVGDKVVHNILLGLATNILGDM